MTPRVALTHAFSLNLFTRAYSDVTDGRFEAASESQARAGIAPGLCDHEAGARKMDTDLADRGIAAPDDDLMYARRNQFADDRIASGIVRSNADDLARLPADGIFRVSGCFGD
jgi:hypothetical protein